MKTIITFLLLVTSLIIVSDSCAGGPQRDTGISVHALPKRVADISGQPWGLQVSYAPYLKPEPGQPFLQSAEDAIAYVKKQDQTVIDHGLWVATTDPSAYSVEEIEFQEKLEIELPKHNIPLFWRRGSEIKNGFKRY